MLERTIAIIGSGVSGLSAALRLTQQHPDVRPIVLESDARWGGVLRTTHQDGFLLENAADSFLTTPPTATALCHHLGLAADLVPTNPTLRRTYVLRRGQLLPMPDGFAIMTPTRWLPFAQTRILSLRGKLRAACELFQLRNTSAQDESVESFVCRRFGRELFDRLVEPLVGSIYAADTRCLSVRAALPRFFELEQQHRSLLWGMYRSRPRVTPRSSENGPTLGPFASLRSGLGSLPDALVAHLPADSVQTRSPVLALEPLEDGRWHLIIGGPTPHSVDVDGVILATPAHQTAKLLQPLTPSPASELAAIRYSSSAVVSLGYHANQIGHPVDGYGLLVPLAENRLILSCTFSSTKLPNRAPHDHVLLRVFVGGECQRGLLALPRAQILELAQREIADLLQIRGEPVLRNIVLHQQATPQYNLGHLDRVARIRRDLESFPTLALACNAIGGVGIPACIQSGYVAADRLMATLRQFNSYQVAASISS